MIGQQATERQIVSQWELTQDGKAVVVEKKLFKRQSNSLVREWKIKIKIKICEGKM